MKSEKLWVSRDFPLSFIIGSCVMFCCVVLCVCVLRLFVWFGKDGSGFDRVGKKREVV